MKSSYRRVDGVLLRVDGVEGVGAEKPEHQRTGATARLPVGQAERERESHLLNPPPGSTDPERSACASGL